MEIVVIGFELNTAARVADKKHLRHFLAVLILLGLKRGRANHLEILRHYQLPLDRLGLKGPQAFGRQPLNPAVRYRWLVSWLRLHGEPLKLASGHFGLGHGSGAHAPDEYYLIESTNSKVQGFDGPVLSFVEYLYELGM